MSGTSREPGAISINKVPFINSCPNWALQRGVLTPMRIGFACWKSPPSLVDLFLLHQVNAFRLNSPPLLSEWCRYRGFASGRVVVAY